MSARASSFPNATGHASHARIRTQPPWIASFEAEEDEHESSMLSQVLHEPQPVHANLEERRVRRKSRDGFVEYEDEGFQSTANPQDPSFKLKEIFRRRRGAARGRKWDHMRSISPVVVSRARSSDPDRYCRLREYLVSSMPPGFKLGNREPSAEMGGVEFHPDWAYTPSLLEESQRPPSAQKPPLRTRLWRMIITHPLVPFVFRLVVLLTSIISLAISAHVPNGCVIFAIVVDCIAVPYLGYMIWDEYTGKPLGLRPANQKSGLVLMDIIFIIFKASSTSLAFMELRSASGSPEQKALAAFLLLGLVSWTVNLTISVFRLVHRLGGSADDDSVQWRGKLG